MTDNPAEQIDQAPAPAPDDDGLGEAWRQHNLALEAKERRLRNARWRTLAWLCAAIAAGVSALAYLIAHPPQTDRSWGLWIGAAVYCVVVCYAASRFAATWRARLLALAAMWRPWAVVLLAGYFLYFVPQGRELGGSLVIGDDHWYLLRAGSLLVALAYWALCSWFSARRGVKEALDAGLIGSTPKNWPSDPRRKVTTAKTPWVFWGPRLVGVCAHLAAAISLGLAAWPDLDHALPKAGAWTPLIAFIAFFVILALICLINWYDRHKLSQHGPRPPHEEINLPQTPGARVAYVWGEARIALAAIGDALFETGRFLSALAISIVVVTFAASVLTTVFVPQLSVGFIVASGAICLSAVIYLLLISASYSYDPLGVYASEEARRQDDTEQAREVARWTFGLLTPAAAVIFAAWADPTWLGRNLGSMVVAFFAFGALLAVLNFFEWITERPTIAATRVIRAWVTAGVVGFCIVNAWITPFHRIRIIPSGVPNVARAPSVDARPSVEDAAERWYDQARQAFLSAHPTGQPADGGKAPMVVVATAGGGIRAAYWTARVLDQITKDSNGLGPYIFAVSGVSGGSVGATAYATSLKDWHHCDKDATPTEDGLHRDCKAGDWAKNLATSYLADDYLAPALTSWLFKDTFASFAPWESSDRAVALENGIEAASGAAMGQSFIDLQSPPNPTHSASSWSPILLLNATHEQTGKRIIASQARVDRNVFVDALDELDVLGHDLPASTAAINSARFTYVSPAGDLGYASAEHQGTLIDGGYYENFGALTALEIAESARKHLEDYIKGKRAAPASDGAPASSSQWPDVKLIIVMITSDPDLGKVTQDRSIDASQSLVRIDRFNGEKCLANVTERGRPHSSPSDPNYLPDIWRKPADSLSESVAAAISEVLENSWVNEFVAPFQGLAAVREAHGNRAASQLALEICTEYLSQGAIADIASRGKQVQSAEAHAATPSPDLPYFVHVGMCRKDSLGKLRVDPPLGWVLSQSTRTGLNDLVCRCGNREEFKSLETATQAEIGVEAYCKLKPVQTRLEAESDVKTPPPGAPAP